MPASPFSVWINLMGSVNPSVARSFSQVNRQLVGLQATVNTTNRILRGTFGRLAGLGGALLGIGGVVTGMKQAVDLSKQYQQIQDLTLTTLRNQRQLRHENIQLASQDLQVLDAQALRLQHQTGLYEGIYERGSLILATSKLNVNQIRSLQPVMANLLVAQRMQGKSAEQMEQTYKAVGMAIERGMGRSLSRQGILLTPIEQRMLTMNAMVGNIAGNIKIVENAITRVYAGAAKARMGTLLGQVDEAMSNMKTSMRLMGDALTPVQQRLTVIFSDIVTLVQPIVIRIANLIDNALKNHMNDIRRWVEMVRQKVVPIMLDWIDKGWKVLKEFIQWFKDNAVPVMIYWHDKGWKLWEDAIKWFLQKKDEVTAAITVIGQAMGITIAPFTKFKAVLQEIQDLIFGTKRYKYDLSKEVFPTGVQKHVERALPAMGGPPEGYLTQMLGWFDKMIDFVGNWMKNSLIPRVKTGLDELRPIVLSWFEALLDAMANTIFPWLIKQIQKIDDAIFGAIPGYKDLRNLIDKTAAKTQPYDRPPVVSTHPGVIRGLPGAGPTPYTLPQVSTSVAKEIGARILGQTATTQPYERHAPVPGAVFRGVPGVTATEYTLPKVLAYFAREVTVQSAKKQPWEKMYQDPHPAYRKGVVSVTESFSDLGKTTDKLIGNDFTHLILATEDATDSFKRFNDSLSDLITTITGQGGTAGQGGARTGGVWNPLGPAPAPHQGPFPGAVRTMSEWVPGEPRTHATQYGPLGHLQLGDIAMSVDLMHKMNLKMGDYVDILDKNNKVILQHQRIADTSWFRPGVMTHGIELWGRPDIGWSQVRASAMRGEEAKRATGPPVTINYNVHHHHEGGAMDENRIAAIHRQHLDRMARDLAEVEYRRNRSSFDGARAV